jgi:hypothetical protein
MTPEKRQNGEMFIFEVRAYSFQGNLCLQPGVSPDYASPFAFGKIESVRVDVR